MRGEAVFADGADEDALLGSTLLDGDAQLLGRLLDADLTNVAGCGSEKNPVAIRLLHIWFLKYSFKPRDEQKVFLHLKNDFFETN